VARITSARAYANNEVAFVAWDIDGRIKGCLGFDLVRVVLDDAGRVALKADGSEDRVRCASWVAFEGQRNPLWIAQDTGVWPVQKLSWRDLTLRKRRDGMQRRPDEVHVRYEVRPVGNFRAGFERVPDNGLLHADVVRRDAAGRPLLGPDGKPLVETVRAYEGRRRPLVYLGPAVTTNAVRVTTRRGAFRSTFTNGILSAQWLRNVLDEDGVVGRNELIDKLRNPRDPHRRYLAGDVLPLIRELFRRPGSFHLALYELEDRELEELLVANAARIHVILANTGLEAGRWDARNAPARERLVKAKVDIQHRMFNNATHIGHHKFVVHVGPDGKPHAVLTGSTNWTSTGLAGQTNNTLLCEDDAVAAAYLQEWQRLKRDRQKVPRPKHEAMPDNQQRAALRKAHEQPVQLPLAGGAGVQLWFSPNRPERRKPRSTTRPPPMPPDLAEVYRRMRLARQAILFLAFYPGQAGRDCIVGEAIRIAQQDPTLLVRGTVSSAQAMPNYRRAGQADDDAQDDDDPDDAQADEGASPFTYETANLSIVRAARIDDRSLLGDLKAEVLTARGGIGAIVHDKVLVIDPLSPDCTVVLGSHNLGYKASYSNDENLLVVVGARELAEAYAVHVLDVYDHYRFRAVRAERVASGDAAGDAGAFSGFLQTTDRWQDRYLDGAKGALTRYFATPSNAR
jgi:phosphatidylserine/phosphatidylglycerophosphate/cardiolipin synthase-like enzyme